MVRISGCVKGSMQLLSYSAKVSSALDTLASRLVQLVLLVLTLVATDTVNACIVVVVVFMLPIIFSRSAGELFLIFDWCRLSLSGDNGVPVAGVAVGASGSPACISLFPVRMSPK